MAEDKTEKLQVSEGDERYADVVYRFRPDKINTVQQDKQSVTFTSENNICLRIFVLTSDIFRLTYTTEDDPSGNFSYALDPDFKPQAVNFKLKEHKNFFEVSTTSISCRIEKKQMLVHFIDADGNLLCEDKHGYYKRESLMNGITEVSISQKAPKETQYFGLGDKAVELNLYGRSYENWNTDSFGYERGDDPLYRSIPFFMALRDGRAYGIFLDNTYRTFFDFDRKKNQTSSFSAEGGQMDYYFINGPRLQSVAKRYSRLTGTAELPPLWALGYHQCRWSYYPEAKVRQIAQKFRELEIPCDAIYLDIDYMDNYKVFSWNKKYFPNPKKLISDLKKDGFQTIVMIDPGIRVDKNYEVYKNGLENDVYCKRPDGDIMIGPVWPPRTVFPDFTHPDVREWWGDLYKEFVGDLKLGGIWNDMNEPAVFEVLSKTFPDNIRHNFDGNPCSHRKAHNIYGMQMARASFQGIRKNSPKKRPFLLTRSNFSGGQRYAALWTGDNIASWDHLRLAHEQCLRLSISGYSFCGTDIGGFVDHPTTELYLRWLQLGIFHPLFRSHTMGYNVDGAAAVKEEQVEKRKADESDLNQEPWAFGKKATKIARKTIELRYQLLQYLYTAFHQYSVEGNPILTPLVFYDQTDTTTLEADDEFMFGDQILVNPVLQKGQTSKNVYLPKGKWYHFWDLSLLEGQQKHSIKTPQKQIPFFIKAGAVIPMREIMQYTGQKKQNILSLFIYAGDTDCKSLLYEDAEQGYDYQSGKYRKTQFLFEPKSNQIHLTAVRKGAFTPSYKKCELHFIGLPFKPDHCIIDGKEITINSYQKNKKTIVRVDALPNFKTVILKN